MVDILEKHLSNAKTELEKFIITKIFFEEVEKSLEKSAKTAQI